MIRERGRLGSLDQRTESIENVDVLDVGKGLVLEVERLLGQTNGTTDGVKGHEPQSVSLTTLSDIQLQ